MTKKEINEIKALFDTIQECGIRELVGCYVDADRNKVKTFSESFHNLPEEEMHKYLEIFRRTLSGTPGKNLMDMHFENTEYDNNPIGKGLLQKLRASELKDEAALNEFYDKVIDTYSYVGNYLILLIYQNYDIPGITDDGLKMEDASAEIYSYILCSPSCNICFKFYSLGFWHFYKCF